MKIIAFPFAGGNKMSYNFFQSPLLDRAMSIKVLEYPRGIRFSECTLRTIDITIDALFGNFAKLIQEESNYIIYGHSMGALIGYLVCKRIEKLGLKKPLKLVVSGRSAPSIRNKETRYDLSSDQFWEKILELGGISEEILKERELKDFFEPILRADFKAVETYVYSGKANLTIPIDVIHGSEEKIEADVLGWKEETSAEVTFTELKGNHFFIYDHAEFFVDLFKKSFDQSITEIG